MEKKAVVRQASHRWFRVAAALAFPTALAFLASCKGEQPAPAPSPVVVAQPRTSASRPVAAPTAARSISEDNALYSFAYAYPAQAAAIPDLKAKLDKHADTVRAELAKESREEKAASDKDFVYRPHSRGFDWKVVADIPGWLSLSTLASTYTGGAHPGYWFEAILWDKAAGKERAVTDLFASKAQLSSAIREQFCTAIDRQRAKKRGEPVQRGTDEMFNDCIDPVAQVLILGSSDRRKFDRIGILVAPYEAGPWAEGDYEVTLPVTAGILALVKPEFQASFAVKP